MGCPYRVWLCTDTCGHTAVRNLPFLSDKACRTTGVPYHLFFMWHHSNRYDVHFHHDDIRYALIKIKV
jgi:hypothetical protein